MDRMDDKLSSLLSQYRDACPGPESSANFMPELWSKIEARRNNAIPLLLKRWTEAWLVATIVLAVVISVFLIPYFQEPPALEASYVDVLSAADSAGDLAVLLRGEVE
ncbi:MAG: hypothetical protein EXQ47_07415 [Bryobacterales bacterium]|nr:hypothetical protein [Bryobacterales bacterium]